MDFYNMTSSGPTRPLFNTKCHMKQVFRKENMVICPFGKTLNDVAKSYWAAQKWQDD